MQVKQGLKKAYPFGGAVNPYLPQNEYIPDAEPYVFEDRVYIYGSHDRFNAPMFCVNNYVCWSAPVDDLSAWHYEGVIYRKTQDPLNRLGFHNLFAPDVVRGADGRYYLYYALDFLGIMSVAVCDTPAGTYQFYGHVRFQDGHVWGTRSGEPFPFDPGVLVDDDERVYLYSGFATQTPAIASRMKSLTNRGCVGMELDKDMLTIINGPRLLLEQRNGKNLGGFKGHAFFEASSIRKVDGQYCLVYSSEHNHELCYAMSDYPLDGFSFGGTLVSIGDMFLHGNEDERKASNYLGNTHGGMLHLNGNWYIFYHRQTNRHSYSRQACAERLQRLGDGRFAQAEVTSCGLNNGPLPGMGQYGAYIACNLWARNGTGRYDGMFPKFRLLRHPYMTQRGKDGDTNAYQYIRNMRDGSVAGFKYFTFSQATKIRIVVAGCCNGEMLVSTDESGRSLVAKMPVKLHHSTANIQGDMNRIIGTQPLYFSYKGRGRLDFYSFELL